MSHFKAKHDQMNINSGQTETVYTSLPQLPGTSTFDEPISARLRMTPNDNEEMDMTLENEMDEDRDSFFDDYGVIDFTIYPQIPIPSQTSSTSQTVTVQEKSFIHDIIPYNIPTNKTPPYQLKCRICKVTYKNHSNFNTHAKKKHNCKFLCSYCSKIFINKELGKAHEKRDHVSECQDCGRRFACEANLMNHCRDKKHHQNDNKINSRQEETSYEPIAARLRSKD
ncbi:hypothetical protein C1646_703311 [Rhizophagus diaphanus]|nr:hypothetical protein C1646_703311 [Rhizophagus diaphanus] [Rhizophagus sp. MUCL 43196]